MNNGGDEGQSSDGGDDGGGDEGDDGGDDEGDNGGDNEGDDGGDDGDDEVCTASLTLNKIATNDDGGMLDGADFQLLIDDEPQPQLEPVEVTPDVMHTIGEEDVSGYEFVTIECTDIDSGDPVTYDDGIALSVGQQVSCTVFNDDIAPTITVHKSVVNDNLGTSQPDDFDLTVNDVVVAQGDPGTHFMANEASVISEIAADGYTATGVVCTSSDPQSSNNKSATNTATIEVTPVLAEEIDCTVTNDDNKPVVTQITINKAVSNKWGGDLAGGDFNLQIDGVTKAQGTPHNVTPGQHEIGEIERDGYALASIVCGDITLGADHMVNVTAGQSVTCTVNNADKPASLTLVKDVINNNGLKALPSDFSLQIDGEIVTQNAPHNVASGRHVITEVAVAGYRLVGITCTDDSTEAVLPYDGGVSLALGQQATCVVTNDDDPIDLVLTKSDDGLIKTAGGAPFNYTITVDNLGPRDAPLSDPVTVVDELPDAFEFVAFPDNCSAAGQVLTCSVTAGRSASQRSCRCASRSPFRPCLAPPLARTRTSPTSTPPKIRRASARDACRCARRRRTTSIVSRPTSIGQPTSRSTRSTRSTVWRIPARSSTTPSPSATRGRRRCSPS